MPVLTLALKDLRLLLRDPRSAVILLLMPLVLILVLGMALGEGFGEKADDRLRISVVNLDRGLPPDPTRTYPPKPWSEVVLDDLSGTADVRLELITDRAEAERLVSRGNRAAVIVFEPEFSERVQRCSFLTHGDPPPINPFDRDGVRLAELALTLKKDDTQPVTASIIEQVAQVTMLRVLIPWMIGRAFERVGDEAFMEALAVKLNDAKPLPPAVLKELDPVVQKLLEALFKDPKFDAMLRKEFGGFGATAIKGQMPQFRKLIGQSFADPELMGRVGKDVSFGELLTPSVRGEVGPRVRNEVQEILSNYDFRAKTWAGLNKDRAREANQQNRTEYRPEGGGLLKRGAVRYQVLVPSYTVFFAFFLVLTVGWLFVAERKHGTLTRLRAAPLSRGQILLGKLLPCLAVSLFQGFFLLLAGRVIFGMTWGSHPELLVAVAACTSVAAVGLAMLVASVARTETQVAVYGTLLVLVLGGISGSLMPRDLMPEQMKRISLVTPQAWALDAYGQLLGNPNPEPARIALACGVLLAFGIGFLALAWWRLDLE